MAANIDKRQKFIELRGEGRTFDEIAKLVNVSKPTLIKWSKESKEMIEEVVKAVEEQFLIEQKIKRTFRGQKLSEELDKAYEALSKTDYKKMNKKELINIIDKLEEKLSNILSLGDNKKHIEINYTSNNKKDTTQGRTFEDILKELYQEENTDGKLDSGNK